MAASETALKTLHRKLAEVLTEIVEGGETVVGIDEDGEPIKEKRRASAGELAVAAKFLKDNSIFSAPEQDDATAALRDKLKNRGRAPSQRDMADAMKSIGKDLLQ